LPADLFGVLAALRLLRAPGRQQGWRRVRHADDEVNSILMNDAERAPGEAPFLMSAVL
jgi:hypothetical protein